MSEAELLRKKKTARANLLAVLVQMDEEIKMLEPMVKKKAVKDFSAIAADIRAKSMRKFKKTA